MPQLSTALSISEDTTYKILSEALTSGPKNLKYEPATYSFNLESPSVMSPNFPYYDSVENSDIIYVPKESTAVLITTSGNTAKNAVTIDLTEWSSNSIIGQTLILLFGEAGDTGSLRLGNTNFVGMSIIDDTWPLDFYTSSALWIMATEPGSGIFMSNIITP